MQTKFAPVIAARRVKREEDEASTSNHTADKRPQPANRGGKFTGRGGGRGRGGRGLLSDRTEQAPAIVSGPFSLGPSQMAAKRQVNVGFGGGPSSRGGRGPPGAKMLGTRAQTVEAAAEDSDLTDLERMMELEALSIGADHTPVYIGAGDKKSTSGQVEEPCVADLIQGLDQLCLFQLPPMLPSLEAVDETAETDTEGKLADKKTTLWSEGLEGQYGKMLVHASGKVSLEINGIRFALDSWNDLSAPSHISGCQSVVAIDPEYEQSFELGQISTTFVASPDISQFL